MKLTMIKPEVCPDCASITVMEACEERRHCNGQPRESRKFACGCTLSWSPNFSSLVVDRACPKSVEEVEKAVKRQKVARIIEGLLEKSDVDNDFKRKVTDLWKWGIL